MSLFVYGDSFSDTNGRTRKTNGPLWSENLAKSWGIPLKSFAQAGALTCARPDEVSDLAQQFISAKPAISSSSKGDVKNTHAIFIGNTDIADGSDTTVQVEPLLRCMKQHVLEIQRLDGDARILLLGLPPLEFSPFYLQSEKKLQSIVKQRTMDFNGAVEDAAQDWHDELKMDISFVDIYTVFNSVLGDPQEYKMENVEDAYWEKCQGTCLDAVDEYLWWDNIHMTGAGHAAISKEILSRLPTVDPSKPPAPVTPPQDSSSDSLLPDTHHQQQQLEGDMDTPFYNQVHMASWFLLFFVLLFILFLLRPARIVGLFKSCTRSRKLSKPAMSGYSIV
ncbi:hypothetical protein BDA99DRAFT_522152 [Phascolomyces articulosus]|uniref:Carbohydrate esterase family 16 protein n=1 Tax=Phascolomyces articulosus TaxID=60185 RepID=A0AAD5JRX4_9FUNG|nr:hypothetical protein BDA99DRAFT_522152 [Phascolomyces articulosus]